MAGLLYPAYQKFYSAIRCLERFSNETDFFENIACLDAFFSEYRSITLVLQKSLAHTPHIDKYNELIEAGCLDQWMNKQRVKTVHIHPVEFFKDIEVSVYFPSKGFTLLSNTYTAENDIPLSTLTESLKTVLQRVDPNEVFFSAKCSFPEKDTGEDVLEKAIAGIESMLSFMEAMYQSVGEECALCEQLRKKIRQSKMLYIPSDLVNDYVYYPQTDEFERSGRAAMVLSVNGKKIASRRPLKSFIESEHFNYDGTPFGNFVLMHAMLRAIQPGMDIMPAIMVVYADKTYDLDAFHADTKTTVYRKLNEVAQRIAKEEIVEVYFMTLYAYISAEGEVPITSKARVKASTSDLLAFMKVDCVLNEEEYVFDGKAMEKMEYVARVMKNGRKNKLELGLLNMLPIIEAFKNKKAQQNTIINEEEYRPN